MCWRIYGYSSECISNNPQIFSFFSPCDPVLGFEIFGLDRVVQVVLVYFIHNGFLFFHFCSVLYKGPLPYFFLLFVGNHHHVQSLLLTLLLNGFLLHNSCLYGLPLDWTLGFPQVVFVVEPSLITGRTLFVKSHGRCLEKLVSAIPFLSSEGTFYIVPARSYLLMYFILFFGVLYFLFVVENLSMNFSGEYFRMLLGFIFGRDFGGDNRFYFAYEWRQRLILGLLGLSGGFFSFMLFLGKVLKTFVGCEADAWQLLLLLFVGGLVVSIGELGGDFPFSFMSDSVELIESMNPASLPVYMLL